MKKVQMFKAVDGVLFRTAKEAAFHEAKVVAAKDLERLLGGKKDPGCRFANGEGYYQLTAKDVEEFDCQFPATLKKFEKFEKWALSSGSLIGRRLSDLNSVFYGVWGLRQCVDKRNRRWGQPYFALNPSEGKQIELTSGRESSARSSTKEKMR